MSQRHLEGYRAGRGAVGWGGGNRLSMASRMNMTSRIDKVLRRGVGDKRGNQELRVWLGYIGKKAGRREMKLRA